MPLDNVEFKEGNGFIIKIWDLAMPKLSLRSIKNLMMQSSSWNSLEFFTALQTHLTAHVHQGIGLYTSNSSHIIFNCVKKSITDCVPCLNWYNSCCNSAIFVQSTCANLSSSSFHTSNAFSVNITLSAIEGDTELIIYECTMLLHLSQASWDGPNSSGTGIESLTNLNLFLPMRAFFINLAHAW